MGEEEIKSNDISTNRNGGVNIYVKSGNVLGGVGGSTAVGIGKITGVGENKFTPFDFEANGNTKTVLNGDVRIESSNGSNLAAWATGGGSMAIGGQAESVVNGNTNLIINSEVNSSKLEGITVGAAGGGLSVSTLGGKADTTVSGTSKVSVTNGLAFGLAGGGAAAAVDGTYIGKNIIDHEQ